MKQCFRCGKITAFDEWHTFEVSLTGPPDLGDFRACAVLCPLCAGRLARGFKSRPAELGQRDDTPVLNRAYDGLLS